MDSIPVRISPLAGEALDSYLETYARRLHSTVDEIFDLAHVTVGRFSNPTKGSKPWMHCLTPEQLTALGVTIAIPTVSEMTLARYNGTGLVLIDPDTRTLGRPRWWRTLRGTRFCPHCLADTNGRWLLSWRLTWSFACTQHHALLRDTCPACGRRHFRTQPPPPDRDGLCDIAGLPRPPKRRDTPPPCSYPLEHADTLALAPDSPILAAQHHIDTVIAALLHARDTDSTDSTDTLLRLQRTLDDHYAAARAAISALWVRLPPPPEVTALRQVLLPESEHFESGSHQLPARVAFGTTVARLMLARGPREPEPAITSWLLRVADDRAESVPTVLLGQWEQASPALQGALLKTVGPRLNPAYQLRYSTLTDTPRRPRAGGATSRVAAIPSLFWRSWALRLNPPGLFDPLPYRHALAMLLAVAGLADLDYQQARTLLRQPPASNAVSAHFTGRLRRLGALETVLTALSRLADALDQNGSPIDYARRRRRLRLSQAELDTQAWRTACKLIRRRSSPRQEHLARLYLIELLTGNHPYYFPAPLTLPTADGEDYATFVFTLPEPLVTGLHYQARKILRRAHLHEPVCWEPPFEWVGDIRWPGPHPDELPNDELWSLQRQRLSRGLIASQLHATVEHVHLNGVRHPMPAPARRPQSRSRASPLTKSDDTSLSAEKLRAYAEQGLGPRAIAKATGHKYTHVTAVLAADGLAQRPARDVISTIDPDWLRHEYEDKRRSIKDIAASLGIPATYLAAYARKLGLALRHGVTSRAHILATHGRASDYPPIVWNVFASPGAEQRLRRLLRTVGHPTLNLAAKHLGVRKDLLARQIQRLEEAAGATLLAPTPTGLALTAAGQQLAHDVFPVLAMLESHTVSANSL